MDFGAIDSRESRARRTFFDANVKFVAGQMILAKASVLVDGQLLSVASTVLATRNSTAACVIRRSTGHSKSIANSMHDLRLNRQILQVRQI